MEKPNRSIECSVDECRYHCGDCSFCSLDTVRIGTHEAHPTQSECVDCNSFSPKD